MANKKLQIPSAFIEGVKELLRTAAMSVVPLIIDQLQDGDIELKSVAIAAAIAILSGIDKWLHKENTGFKGNGLTGF